MKFTKSILMGTGSVVLAGLILTLLMPKAANAIAATAVQVMNTSTNPVPVQSLLPGKPFIQTCTNFTTSSNCALSPPVPAGYTFAVQHSNAVSLGGPAGVQPIYWFFTTQGQPVYEVQLLQQSASGPAVNDSPVAWYADAASSPHFFLYNGTAATIIATLTGYLTPE